MADVSITSKRKETIRWPDNTFGAKVFITVCNETKKPIQIKISDNPWWHFNEPAKYFVKDIANDVDEDGNPIAGSARQKALDRWINPRTNDNSPFTLTPKGPAGSCFTFEFTYISPPEAIYIDVYVIENGQPRNKFDPHATDMWYDLRTALHWPNIKPRCAYAFFLPYPMALETLHDGPATFVVDSLIGLPKTFELINMWPAVGEHFTLDLSDRVSQGMIVLRQLEPVVEDHYLELKYHPTDPRGLEKFERSIGFTLSGARAYGTLVDAKLP